MAKIKVYNKIGFHCGPAGNHNGIGDYMRKLDAAGIPFVMKSVDHYGYIYEGLQYSNANHLYVYRMSAFGQPGDYNFDVPDYEIDPDEAAAKHWKHMMKHLPPEFDRRKVWLEPINEIDKNRSDWLGHFAAELGDIALKDGYKISQFAWSSGEPEPDHWETEGMLRYLKMCQDHPDQMSIALHEYSYDKNDIWRLRPELVGRFTQLFDICDKHGLKRPKVIMSEWGWTHRRVPSSRNAIDHIREVNELYARYPEILGAAIWYLGGGFDIADGAQKLIGPVTDFSLSYSTEVEPDVPKTAAASTAATATRTATAAPAAPNVSLPGGAPIPSRTVVMESAPMAPAAAQPAAPTVVSNVAFVSDLTIPDDTEVTAGTKFTKTWRIRNTGQTTWDANYKLAFIGGDPMGDQLAVSVPSAVPGQIVDVSVEMRAPAQKEGTVYGDWRMHTPEGVQFGDVIYVRIDVTPPLPVGGVNNAAFAADVTIPDDTVMEPGKSFRKTWKVRNSGSKAWGANYKLGFVGGARMAAVDTVDLPPAAPGQTVEVSIDMRAPEIPGTHWADWRPQDELGNFFGEILYVRITVPQPEGKGRITPISQNDPRWKDTRLGDAGSDTTIGAWGCLLTTFTMIANSFGKDLSPQDLNRQMVLKRLFLDHKATPWNALSSIYNDIIYEGRLEMRNTPNLTDRIDAALRSGNPVAVQVDYTPDSPYTPNDQHWVLIVGREASDYRINETWVYPAQEMSMRSRYGRAGQSLKKSIISAVFYRTTKPQPALPVVTGGVLSTATTATQAKVLQSGMNVNPDAPNSNPYQDDTFKGLDWVRFVYKVAAAPDPNDRTLRAAFQKYDAIVREYNKMGVRSLIILNQETVWGNAPWSGNNDWNSYADQLARTATQIARRYKSYGDKVAYEIWNEGDLPNNPASVYVPPQDFAVVLQKVSAAIRKEAPEAKIVFGGMASGPNHVIPYVQQVQTAAGGELPVDALGIHPYGRWGTKAPFDWGKNFGTLGEAFEQYAQAFPKLPLWITEIGVAADTSIGPEYYEEIGNYIRDVYQHVGTRHVDQVPVVIWFAWSDLMRNAGIVQVDGQHKSHVYDAFKAVRNKEIM